MTRISGNKAIIDADLRPYFQKLSLGQRVVHSVTRKIGIRRIGRKGHGDLAFGGKTVLEQMDKALSYPLRLGLMNAARAYERALPGSEHRDFNSHKGRLRKAYLKAQPGFGRSRLKKKRLFGISTTYQARYGAYSTVWVNSRVAPHAHLVEYGTVKRYTKKKQYRGIMPALKPMRNTLDRAWPEMVRAHNRSFRVNYTKALKALGKEIPKDGFLSIARPVR